MLIGVVIDGTIMAYEMPLGGGIHRISSVPEITQMRARG